MAKSRILAVATHIGRRAYRYKLSVISTFFVIFFVIPIFLYTLLGTYLANDPRLVPHAIRNARNVLLITAHPDDESLFFSPSILHNSEKPHVNRHLLVLSSGNFNGLGEHRRTETKASCAALGIRDDNCVILNDKDLQDNPRQWWDDSIIEKILGEYIKKWNIDLIITFDHYGVSGHVNHRSVSKGVKKFCDEHDHMPPIYTNQSKFLLRKYSSLFDLIPTSLPFSWRILEALIAPVPMGYETQVSTTEKPVPPPQGGDIYGDKALIVTDWGQYMQGRRAFKQHASQYSWDRVLYLIVSRYMWFNDLRRL
ncbi:hypothetical protein TMatcc_009439 [Talaromyces marneffei ATCC 18224]|uniref:N-acetylglucosaminylphosphatidylinositol deacetylase n=2 Tax=Talaromyces marneffei TaxID=37727 RepID=B6QSB9_TALMQ|nr:uncharacterized protein EYB26_008687 [Talaromyces marneffei]EEA19304.1 glycan biosynthesis protein (PigL), putative [Talaromyces marneffei ATCC 18224]KAE8547632.1 hypothetical protein EYB25_009425 [Talaromyces marneffei]QGA20977.1 hypothetical protein EYB26_008687 [Talaromyces marneffei]